MHKNLKTYWHYSMAGCKVSPRMNSFYPDDILLKEKIEELIISFSKNTNENLVF